VGSVQLWLALFSLALVVTLAARSLLSRTLAPLSELGLTLARRREARTQFVADAERFMPFAEPAAVALELSAREQDAARQLTAAGEAAGGDRSAFLRAVSHELRTPLNAIIGFTDVLQNELDGPITSDQRENLAIIRASSDTLARLVSDMIDVSDLAASDASRPRTAIDVVALLETVRDAVEERRGLRPVYVRVEVHDGAELLRADREGLLRALRILAEHAIEVTEAGEVSLVCERAPGEHVLRVHGDGLELADEEHAVLRGEIRDLDRKRRSALLRLAIARELVVLQGGRIELASALAGRVGGDVLVHMPDEPAPPSVPPLRRSVAPDVLASAQRAKKAAP
jgi:signal transduction histidine kinase